MVLIKIKNCLFGSSGAFASIFWTWTWLLSSLGAEGLKKKNKRNKKADLLIVHIGVDMLGLRLDAAIGPASLPSSSKAGAEKKIKL